MAEGESNHSAFVKTLTINLSKTMVLKTIVAFLNTEGGDILVGISDDYKITGLDSSL